MGRKFELLKQSNWVLSRIRSGAPKTKLKRKLVVYQVINELVELGIAPPKLESINKEHVEAIVKFWQQRSLSTATIVSNMSMLRCFFKLASPGLVIPSNAELGVAVKKSESNIPKTQVQVSNQYESILQKIETAFTKSVIAFQLYFGLTKMESIKLNLSYALIDGSLLIDRALASNRKDRYVPIVSLEQEKAIADRKRLLSGKATLIDLLSISDASKLYKAETCLAGIEPRHPFRAYYANKRLNDLLKIYQEPEALKKLQNEIGLKSKYVLEQLLW